MPEPVDLLPLPSSGSSFPGDNAGVLGPARRPIAHTGGLFVTSKLCNKASAFPEFHFSRKHVLPLFSGTPDLWVLEVSRGVSTGWSRSIMTPKEVS